MTIQIRTKKSIMKYLLITSIILQIGLLLTIGIGSLIFHDRIKQVFDNNQLLGFICLIFTLYLINYWSDHYKELSER